MRFQKLFLNFGLSLLTLILSGCGGSSDSTPAGAGAPNPDSNPPSASFKTLTLDASAGGPGALPTDPNNKYTYLNLSAGEVVELTDAEANDSTVWEIAFKRDSIKLNGGVSGKKGVAGFFTGNNADAYGADGKPIRSWFEAATTESELADFEAVTAAQIPEDSAFQADKLVPAIKGDGTSEGWWLYDPDTRTVSENPAKWWIVRSAEGNSYAKFHVTGIVRDNAAGLRKITLEWSYQGPGEATFDADTSGDPQTHLIEISLAGGAKYLDFDSRADSDDPGSLSGWDLKVEYDTEAREYRILVNGGVSGSGKAGVQVLSDPDSVTNGADRSQVAHYFSDKTGGIFVASSWYAYNLTGSDHKLWPNYRVYLIKSGEEVYKLQILAYYHPETRESGWYTIRIEKIAP